LTFQKLAATFGSGSWHSATLREQQQTEQDVLRLDKENTALKSLVANQSSAISILEQIMANQTAELSELKSCASAHVAFYATLPHDRFAANGLLSQFVIGETVNWNNVSLNQGGGYNATTGEFTCPVSGVYAFHVHTQGAPSSTICLDLKVNETPRVGLHKGVNTQRNEATLTHVVQLQRGDRVAVDVSCGTVLLETVALHGNYFTGHLISAGGCNF